MISLYGACESMSYYDYSEDYRVANSSSDDGTVDNLEGGWYHMFPSVNSTYCEAQDEACVRCRAIAYNASEENNYLASTTKYCLGTNGCVCILGCESPDWSAHVRSDCEESSGDSDTTITASSGSDTSSTQGSRGKSAMGEAMWVFGSVLLLIICAALFELYRQRRQISQRMERRRRRTSNKRSSDLQLSHWYSMQQQLIAHEKSSGGTVISSSRGLVPLSDRQPEES